jgi:hypothetical protein
MELTVTYLQNQFKKYNALFFNNELPWILIKIGRSKRNFGIYHTTTSRSTGKILKQHIMISKYYDQTAKQYDETLIHEMIHYYIRFKGIKDNCSHGIKFHKIMHQINCNSEFNITITGDSTNMTSKIEDNKIYRIMKFTYNGKEYYAKISNSFNVKRFSNIIKNPSVFYSKNNYFAKWKLSCSMIHYHTINDEELSKLRLVAA